MKRIYISLIMIGSLPLLGSMGQPLLSNEIDWGQFHFDDPFIITGPPAPRYIPFNPEKVAAVIKKNIPPVSPTHSGVKKRKKRASNRVALEKQKPGFFDVEKADLTLGLLPESKLELLLAQLCKNIEELNFEGTYQLLIGYKELPTYSVFGAKLLRVMVEWPNKGDARITSQEQFLKGLEHNKLPKRVLWMAKNFAKFSRNNDFVIDYYDSILKGHIRKGNAQKVYQLLKDKPEFRKENSFGSQLFTIINRTAESFALFCDKLTDTSESTLFVMKELAEYAQNHSFLIGANKINFYTSNFYE
jgi:hypothetical protein